MRQLEHSAPTMASDARASAPALSPWASCLSAALRLGCRWTAVLLRPGTAAGLIAREVGGDTLRF